jgi:hypothetical protein
MNFDEIKRLRNIILSGLKSRLSQMILKAVQK